MITCEKFNRRYTIGAQQMLAFYGLSAVLHNGDSKKNKILSLYSNSFQCSWKDEYT